MHDIFCREPDPLDGMLAPPSLPPDAEALRQGMYAQTRRVLRRRRRLRQFAYAAALAASFAAGLLVMWAMKRPTLTPLPEPVAERHDEPRPPDKPPTPQSDDDSALAREWDALDSSDQRSERYRQAGDHYMEEETDLQSALRCYRNALDHGTERDRTISTDDNWLLMAIKDARQKEKDYAKNGG